MKISAAGLALFVTLASTGVEVRTAQSADISAYPTHAVRFVIPS